MRSLSVSILLIISLNCYAQFDEEVAEFKKDFPNKPFYFLGNFSVEDSNWYKITLSEEVNIDTPNAFFYLILTAKDTLLDCISRGGQSNYLWTTDVKQKIIENQSCFLAIAMWSYRNYNNNRSGNFNVLGTFSIELLRKNARDNLKTISFTLRKTRDEN